MSKKYPCKSSYEEQTVRNKLNEYVKEGIFLTEKTGRKLYYKLSPLTLDELIGRFKGLSDAVTFFSETQWFGFVGNTILHTCGLKNDLFLMKHNYIVHTLEDDILEQIMSAMDKHRFVEIRSFSIDEDGRDCKLLPIKILSSVQTGRRYIAGFASWRKKPVSLRLDHIKKIRPLEVCEDYGARIAEFEEQYKHCFGVSFGFDESPEPVEVRITFRVDEENEGFILERIKREMRQGSLERLGKNRYLLTERLSDPNEMMHWVKSFIGRIERFEGATPEVCERFENDIKRLHEMYGGDASVDVQ